MTADVGETFVNYTLCKDVRGAAKAGVIELGIDSEEEDRFISELERRLKAFDDKETYIAVKTLIKTHKTTVVKTLEYMEKEGENHENSSDF